MEAAMFGADDVRRYAFRQGPGRDVDDPFEGLARPLTSSFGTLPAHVATDRMCPLVWGTVDLGEDAVFPEPFPDLGLPARERIQHALLMAFGLQRREPSNLFNDHRSCASVRSRFPVHAFVHTDDDAWFLDVYRHGLLPVGDACPRWPDEGPIHVAMAGRYTHLPSLYGRLRGPLVELELGISLRSLCVALEVVGLTGDVRLPGPDVGALMAQLALDPPAQWSVPLTVTVAERHEIPAGVPDAAPTPQPIDRDDDRDDDPTLAEVISVNRTSLAVADVNGAHPKPSWRGTAEAIPDGLAPSAMSWSEVLWHRNAGRMPRGLAGVSGRRQTLGAAALSDAVNWLAAPPPTLLLRAIAGRITVSACLQGAEGLPTGWYRLRRPTGGDEDRHRQAHLDLVTADPSLPGRLEECYGHRLTPNAGCAVRHAAMVWLLSIDVAYLVDDLGAGAWTLAQYASGWMAHGLCLAAAAHGMYARPSRAFDETRLHQVVDMAPGEIVLLSVVSGAGRFVEPFLDLRT
jgi:hypothetical protein